MHGLTAHEAAKLIGVARQTYSAWTTGKREPSTSVLVRIHEMFEVDPLTMMRMPPAEFIPQALGDHARYARTDRRIAAAVHPDAEVPTPRMDTGTV